ncbi:MAG: glycosyltransferase, partial [Burkholderiales bacterium]|nr:glycosyltransferase [Burkholderiales bacterium]
MRKKALVNCPDISVIVPAYNAEGTLRRAVHSALSQTGITLEVIVIDDCSRDNTLGIARSLEAADSRVVVIARNVTSGVSRARNDGLEIARGHWVTPLDADDSYVSGRLAAMLA